MSYNTLTFTGMCHKWITARHRVLINLQRMRLAWSYLFSKGDPWCESDRRRPPTIQRFQQHDLTSHIICDLHHRSRTDTIMGHPTNALCCFHVAGVCWSFPERPRQTAAHPWAWLCWRLLLSISAYCCSLWGFLGSRSQTLHCNVPQGDLCCDCAHFPMFICKIYKYKCRDHINVFTVLGLWFKPFVLHTLGLTGGKTGSKNLLKENIWCHQTWAERISSSLLEAKWATSSTTHSNHRLNCWWSSWVVDTVKTLTRRETNTNNERITNILYITQSGGVTVKSQCIQINHHMNG